MILTAYFDAILLQIGNVINESKKLIKFEVHSLEKHKNPQNP